MSHTSGVPETMRASVLTGIGEIAVEERPVPAVRPDEVLVRVAAVGVCGSDVHYYREGRIGDFVIDGPLVLGHEVSGRIVAVGADVDTGRIGERVAIEPQRPCRMCGQCKAGRYNLCPHMEFYATPPVDGAFCEYVTIQADFAHPVPDALSDEAAALLEPLSVGIWAARKARIVPGSRVLIAGAGPIGVIAAQAAKAFGATEIIVSDPVADRRALVERFGATRTIDPVVESVRDLGVDAFIDASGATPAVVSGIGAVRGNGVVVLVGMGADEIPLPIPVIQSRELVITGVFRYTDTWPVAAQLVASGQVDLDSLVTARFSLEDAEKALNADKTPGSLKTIVVL
ncbi:NAD(P)-dependent alcohol dehydrogenase [Streptomyces fulvoviolaceus]|uniref:NAD(P)-dependent alcohol dehydrogenase n=1 Tax=Streptomyces fulvoviolaceus TaxID=285535 RepID=UPI000A50DAD3|nr:NAD(P)-dependent alcohol dehydrogenase [Streptomyces fulvoviolaceus]MCT9080873.1 NAD(P)-dependent alcohol dehydrogenase [Streptomyces fulvoviolaceus]